MTGGRKTGLVVLAGGGPGDPELITLAAERWISKADVLVYDRLVNAAILQLARQDAQKIYVGKSPGRPSISQQRINELLIAKARGGDLVVRLKGGDPMVFGRGAEEADALAAAGVHFRIVPGITAALAAAACTGIPLTDRRVGPAVALVSGHEEAARSESAIDWDALARVDTVVFYMPVGNLQGIADRLQSAGRAGSTPTAVVQNAAGPRQRTLVATLATIAAEAKAANIRPPAVVIVGQVVETSRRTAWMEKLPLFGQTVVVTRPRRQAPKMSCRLRELGADVIEAPAIKIEPPEDFGPLDAALRRLSAFDWLVLTSANGARCMLDRLSELGMDARALAGVRVAAVGPATAEAIRTGGIEPDLTAKQFTTRALGEALMAAGPLTGRKILLARADNATPLLAEMLAGAELQQVIAYRATRPATLPDAAVEALRRGEVNWVTFTSSAAVRNFLALIDSDVVDLSKVKFAAMGPVTAETLTAAHLPPTVTAQPHTIEALVEAICLSSSAGGN